MTDTPTPDLTAPERFYMDYHHTQTYAGMFLDKEGDWVRYSDYAALTAKLKAAEAERDKYKRLWEQARGIAAGKRARQKGGEG